MAGKLVLTALLLIVASTNATPLFSFGLNLGGVGASLSLKKNINFGGSYDNGGYANVQTNNGQSGSSAGYVQYQPQNQGGSAAFDGDINSGNNKIIVNNGHLVQVTQSSGGFGGHGAGHGGIYEETDYGGNGGVVVESDDYQEVGGHHAPIQNPNTVHGSNVGHYVPPNNVGHQPIILGTTTTTASPIVNKPPVNANEPLVPVSSNLKKLLDDLTECMEDEVIDTKPNVQASSGPSFPNAAPSFPHAAPSYPNAAPSYPHAAPSYPSVPSQVYHVPQQTYNGPIYYQQQQGTFFRPGPPQNTVQKSYNYKK